MLSVALKGTVDWRMVMSGLVCFVWRKIFFLVVASGMLISHVKTIMQ